MKYIVAVSGGVDSVVLLDMLVKSGAHELIVAHFDHGIREDSAADARFVAALAKKYGLAFVMQREELGAAASEELARERRYTFLRALAKKHLATIVTAHHSDDVIETIAINVIRGTGWRGLAVMGATDIKRPLIAMTKRDIYTYALDRRLEWVEDGTNASDSYLRNRLRKALTGLPLSSRQRLYELWQHQTSLRRQIDDEVNRLMQSDKANTSRYFFVMAPEMVATEVLRVITKRATGKSIISAQLHRGVLALKTLSPGKVVQLGDGVELVTKKDHFIARLTAKMI